MRSMVGSAPMTERPTPSMVAARTSLSSLMEVRSTKKAPPGKDESGPVRRLDCEAGLAGTADPNDGH